MTKIYCAISFLIIGTVLAGATDAFAGGAYINKRFPEEVISKHKDEQTDKNRSSDSTESQPTPQDKK